MKVLIPILIGSLIVGCEKRLSKEDVIGKYESDGPKANVDIAGKKIFEYRMDLLKGGTCVHFMDDEINFEGRWEIKGNEIHQISGGMVAIYRVNPDKSLTNVESKLGEMLIKIPEDIQYTYTKIYRETNKTPSKNVGKSWTKAKSEPVKEFTLRKKVIGAYELQLKKFGETQRYVLLDNSTVEYYLNGKKEEAEHKWSIVDKEVHIERENKAVSVFSINKDESITGIATIDEDGKRKEIPKERQYTREKIK